MSERAAYSRVYWSIVDDAKFVTIYDDDHHLAAWMRLLLIADQSHPASAHLPSNVRRASVKALADVNLIDIQPNHRYRVHGLDAERERRKIAATTRGPNGGGGGTGPGPDGNRTGTGRSPDGIQTPGLSLAEPREAEDSQAEPSPAGGPDILDIYYRLTTRFPTSTTAQWLTEIANEFGEDATARMLATVYTSDRSSKTLISRLENELRASVHAADRAALVRERERLEAQAKSKHITPEQAEANRARLAEVMAEMLGEEAS